MAHTIGIVTEAVRLDFLNGNSTRPLVNNLLSFDYPHGYSTRINVPWKFISRWLVRPSANRYKKPC